MDTLYLIILNVILPVFILIGLGAFLHRKFFFDMNTLSKLNTFLLLPTLSFVNIYETSLKGEILVRILGFLTIQNLILMLLSAMLAKVFKFDQSLSATFKNSVVLNNSGNFGLPVSQLVFHENPLGTSIQVVVTIFQNFITYTYGLMTSVSVNTKGLGAMKEFFKNPIIYALLLGMIFNALTIKIPFFIWRPIDDISNAFLAIALITLGAQSAFLKLTKFSLQLILSLVGRLIFSPIIAFIIIIVLNLEGTIAQALFIASSFPSSRNSALFALEYKNNPEYAAQAVLLSTLFSSITVTVVVYLAKILF
ncbi:AEC family transporter [Metabacillus bambusae]|uniref:AEC family transporter n=1 Tax=Metabacillus bambusae TaxID=2795218 RepID=A0ABS3N9G3_9BACI|nr:AEC family transporter [Metabacillus bambusae]MBO1514553.1 AEC family transporter [Metabacillus bambusae]